MKSYIKLKNQLASRLRPIMRRAKRNPASEIINRLPSTNALIVKHCEIARGLGVKHGGNWVLVTNTGSSKESQKDSLIYCKNEGLSLIHI